MVIKSWIPSRNLCIAHFQNSPICRVTLILLINNFRKIDLMRVTATYTNIDDDVHL